VSHDRALPVVAIVRVDPGHPAQGRIATVGGNDKTGSDAAVVGEHQRAPVVIGFGRADLGGTAQGDARFGFERAPQRVLDQAVLDDMTEGGDTLVGGIEPQLPWRQSVPDLHVPIGAGACRGNGRPDVQTPKQIDRRWRQRDDAQVDVVLGAPWRRRPGLDYDDVEPCARKAERKRGADHAGTDDGDIVTDAPIHRRAPVPTPDRD
jgi:hypothetical protein